MTNAKSLPEVAVRLRREHEPQSGVNLSGLIHTATVESEHDYFVWCWGETAHHAWVEVSDAPNCLRCIAQGPRKPWVRNEAGILVRPGPRLVTYDTETA